VSIPNRGLEDFIFRAQIAVDGSAPPGSCCSLHSRSKERDPRIEPHFLAVRPNGRAHIEVAIKPLGAVESFGEKSASMSPCYWSITHLRPDVSSEFDLKEIVKSFHSLLRPARRASPPEVVPELFSHIKNPMPRRSGRLSCPLLLAYTTFT